MWFTYIYLFLFTIWRTLCRLSVCIIFTYRWYYNICYMLNIILIKLYSYFILYPYMRCYTLDMTNKNNSHLQILIIYNNLSNLSSYVDIGHCLFWNRQGIRHVYLEFGYIKYICKTWNYCLNTVTFEANEGMKTRSVFGLVFPVFLLYLRHISRSLHLLISFAS